METYQYTSLHGHDEFPDQASVNVYIRLITLEPGYRDAAIVVELNTWLLQRGSSTLPSYHAVSYVWGTQSSPQTVCVRDKGQLKTLRITQNLASALRHIRKSTQALVLWVDAICINQEDTDERSSQVAAMGDIYSLADNVVVWLGEGSEDSSLGIRSIEALSVMVERTDGTSGLRWKDGFSDSARNSVVQNSRAAISLYNLFSREWFERLWVRQEVFFARSTTLVCGDNSMPWSQLELAWDVLFAHQAIDTIEKAANVNPGTFWRRLQVATVLVRRQRVKFAHLRKFCGHVKCTDPRDRIFGLLGLLAPNDLPPGCRPDYSLSLHDVYLSAVSFHIEYTKQLDILFSCELQGGDFNDDFPSWVPDFRIPLIAEPVSVMSYASSVLPSDFAIDGASLKVRASKAGTVISCRRIEQNLGGDSSTLIEFEEHLCRLWEFVTSTSADPGIANFCLVLGGGQLRESFLPPTGKRIPSLEQCSNLVKDVLNDMACRETKWTPEDFSTLQAYNYTFSQASRNRSLVVTDQGQLGLAPLWVKPGDEIYVVLGCRLPLLLRPAQRGAFQVVGPGFFPQFDDGTVILGPLPEGIRKTIYNLGQSWSEGFLDTNSHQILDGDPRLQGDPLWEKVLVNGQSPRYELLPDNGRKPRLITIL